MEIDKNVYFSEKFESEILPYILKTQIANEGLKNIYLQLEFHFYNIGFGKMFLRILMQK